MSLISRAGDPRRGRGTGTGLPRARVVHWTSGGTSPDWASAREATIAAVQELVSVEGVQEYRFRIDDAEGIVNPARSTDGEVVVGDLGRLIPADRDTR